MAASWMCLVGTLMMVLLVLGHSEGVGINWGTCATHNLPPDVVVQMLKDNGIQKVKIFDRSVMDALKGSGIEIMITIPNSELPILNKMARIWVYNNIINYDDVNVRYVALGDGTFLNSNTLDSLADIQQAIDDAELPTIKATVPVNADFYNFPKSKPYPSAGTFRADILDEMTEVVSFLASNNAPFIANINPFLALYGHDDFPVNFTFFDGSATPISDPVNGIQYNNVFDANFDTLVSALKATGVNNLTILVGEIGWPTDGDKNANIQNAVRFYNGLLPRLKSNKGTPLRPGKIDVYLSGLLDEDYKNIAPGNFERHWGIFRYDGQPKFMMNVSGNRGLVGAKNVEYMAQKWCVIDPGAKDLSKVDEKIRYACKRVDCTAMGYGSSCNGMDEAGNASYAFNMYYQVHGQRNSSCGFKGLAKVTMQNPSRNGCNFPIQIASAYSILRRSRYDLVLLLVLAQFIV